MVPKTTPSGKCPKCKQQVTFDYDTETTCPNGHKLTWSKDKGDDSPRLVQEVVVFKTK